MEPTTILLLVSVATLVTCVGILVARKFQQPDISHNALAARQRAEDRYLQRAYKDTEIYDRPVPSTFVEPLVMTALDDTELPTGEIEYLDAELAWPVEGRNE